MVSFIDFPIFYGVSGDLRPWISWLEDFFVREKFTAIEKMNLAQSLLEGKAGAWFYRNQKMLPFQSWEDLTDNLWLTFGDFAEHDRYLREIRDKARIQRMKTTSITKKDSIWETETEALVPILDSLEEESITQNQVPISSLEPDLSFSCESLVVSDARQSEIVSNNWVHSQSVLESVKNMNDAHHVFDELSHRRHKCQPRKKLSLSPKSWMFKFKNMPLPRNWSQLDLHQVIDISKVNNLSPCVSANFGLVRKHRTLQTKRKLSLSLKTWMFKFKPASQRSKSLDIKFFSVEDIAWLTKDYVIDLQSNPSSSIDFILKADGKYDGKTEIEIKRAYIFKPAEESNEREVPEAQPSKANNVVADKIVESCDDLGSETDVSNTVAFTVDMISHLEVLNVCPFPENDSGSQKRSSGTTSSTMLDQENQANHQPKNLLADVGLEKENDSNSFFPLLDSLRFEVSQNTGRIHLYSCILGISMSCFGDIGRVLVMVIYFNLDGKRWYTKIPLLIQPFEVQAQPLRLSQDQKAIDMAHFSSTEKPVSMELATVVAYRLQLPPASKMCDDVFHVSQLMHSSVPPALLEEELLMSEAIIAVRVDVVERREFFLRPLNSSSIWHRWRRKD